MRPFARLCWKEARELLRAKYVLPFVMMPILFIAVGQSFGGVAAAVGDQPTVGVVVHDDGEYAQGFVDSVAANADVAYRGDNRTAAIEQTTAAGGRTVIVVPANFSERIAAGERARIRQHTTLSGVSLTTLTASATVEGVIDDAAHNLTKAKTGATDAELDPVTQSYTTVVEGKSIQGSVGALSATLFSTLLFVPLVIMVTITFSGQMVMNAMASERENRTLETLLSLPVPRRQIVAAKLLGGASLGALAAIFYTGGIAGMQASFGGFAAASAGLSLGGLDYLLIGLSLFLTLVGTLALALALGLFADSQQGAQILLMPIAVLALVPLGATVVADITTLSTPLQALLYLIPFTHPIVAPKALLFDRTLVVAGGILYELCFATGAIVLTVRLFESDRPITGSSGWVDRILSSLQR